MLKLYEEVGEFSQAILIQKRKSRPEKYVSEEVAKNEVAKELADVLGMVMFNAHLLGLDMEKALKEKGWIDRKK